MLRRIPVLLLLSFALIGQSCKNLTSGPEEDDCDIGRLKKVENLKKLDPTHTDHFLITDGPVDINCHGKFQIVIRRLNPSRALDTTEPKVTVSFGTDFIFGAGFPIMKKRDHDRDHSGNPKLYYWEYRADQGAKNLNQNEDWKYTAFIQNDDPTDSLMLVVSSIDYKPK
jgi:hypothetical protein